ncbi:MAG: murein L,D-transpeptidase catalytic domain family protein [Verrucomicrobiae bacterium]|nr:murein L,D-transpeptidase catalytic domain family protein [Verrucomicrobiae bacterium]
MTRLKTRILTSAGLILFPVFFTSCTSPVVSENALTFAKKRVAAEVGEKPEKGTLIVVDYTKPSSEKRLSVVDMKTGRGRMNSLVAHGVNSGLLYATDFSNQVGSEKSSLGLYQLAEEYTGKHGTSFRLDGLDAGLNSNARKRAIVVHSADYATREAMKQNRHEYGRLGRSAGCLALSDKDLAKLDRKMERPVYVFAYAPTLAQTDYLPTHLPIPATSPGLPTQPPQMVPTETMPPGMMLASAEQRSPGAQVRSLREVPVLDRPAIPRPALIETGPVPMGQAPMTTNLMMVSRLPSQQP